MTCPCCDGAAVGNWSDLCDPCLTAWLNGDDPHYCNRPPGY